MLRLKHEMFQNFYLSYKLSQSCLRIPRYILKKEMGRESNRNQAILDDVMHYIFITGEKGRYEVSVDPTDCSILIRIPGGLTILDNIKTIKHRNELYRSFDSIFYYQIKELLSGYEYRKMVIRLNSRK